jgi:hypothetical protein
MLSSIALAVRGGVGGSVAGQIDYDPSTIHRDYVPVKYLQLQAPSSSQSHSRQILHRQPISLQIPERLASEDRFQ